MLRRSLIAALLAGALSAVSVGSVFAHECVISSRSDQGNEGAANSKVWDKLFLADILGFIHGTGQALTPAQIAWAVANRGDLPAYWVTRIDKTIGEGSSNPNLANGAGLDHLRELVGGQVFGLYLEALNH